jgi:hypothetical protein
MFYCCKGDNCAVGLLGLDGNPIERTPEKYPYSHDPYVIWQKTGDFAKDRGATCIYTDRMYQRDFHRIENLVRSYFGNISQYWDDREPEKVEALLREWANDPEIELTMIAHHVNFSSGYPLWSLHYTSPKLRELEARQKESNVSDPQ